MFQCDLGVYKHFGKELEREDRGGGDENMYYVFAHNSLFINK